MEKFIKLIGCMSFGVISAAFKAVYPLVILSLLFVIADCISAWRLSRRVKKHQCTNAAGTKSASGKFKSRALGRTVFELIIIIPTGLMLAYWTQEYLLTGLGVPLTKIFAGIVIFWQLWSILENESSCSHAKWARLLQKILIDKTERHLDIDLSDLKKGEKDETY
ncbi:MAG: hypothetical protein LBV74_01130 [Tannerella sp.]|jgi:hypothetical protein|nr:hypothetical protein [Tannerella sp.]